MKTFLLGVGCQKGGTTWVHDYLSTHPQVDMGFEKEYHIFDALHLRGNTLIRQRTERLKNLIIQDKFHPKRHLSLVQKLAFYEDQNLYFDYFQQLLLNPSINLTGDITPAYAVLNAPVFRRINNQFLKRRIDVKVVFLMRDPIERIRSSYNMYLRSRGAASGAQVDLASYIEGQDVILRTTYDRTIKELEKVFDQSQLFYGFYEELFRDDSMLKEMVKFLQIRWKPADFGRVVNGGSDAKSEVDVEAGDIIKRFSGTYNFIKDRFGEERVRGIWQGC